MWELVWWLLVALAVTAKLNTIETSGVRSSVSDAFLKGSEATMPTRYNLGQFRFMAVLLLVGADAVFAGQVFFVATDGNDAWSGALPATNATKTDGPFATLQRAREAVRQYKRSPGLQQPVTVEVRAGTYVLSETLTFTAEDSGTAECSITFRAHPDEVVQLVGAKPVGGWSKHQGQILTTSLADQGFTSFPGRALGLG